MKNQLRLFLMSMVCVLLILSGVAIGFTFGVIHHTKQTAYNDAPDPDPVFHYGQYVKVSRGFYRGREGRVLDFSRISGYTLVVDKRFTDDDVRWLQGSRRQLTELIHVDEHQLESVDQPELAPPLPHTIDWERESNE
jgi:hypothetical protein